MSTVNAKFLPFADLKAQLESQEAEAGRPGFLHRRDLNDSDDITYSYISPDQFLGSKSRKEQHRTERAGGELCVIRCKSCGTVLKTVPAGTSKFCSVPQLLPFLDLSDDKKLSSHEEYGSDAGDFEPKVDEPIPEEEDPFDDKERPCTSSKGCCSSKEKDCPQPESKECTQPESGACQQTKLKECPNAEPKNVEATLNHPVVTNHSFV